MSSGDGSQLSSLLSTAHDVPAATMQEQSVGPTRCCWVGRGCTKVKKTTIEDSERKPCTVEGSCNMVHHACWQQLLLSVLKQPTEVMEVACCVSHLKQLGKDMVAAAKNTAGDNTDKKQRVSWVVDGLNPEVCLTSCLLDWISTHGNYH